MRIRIRCFVLPAAFALLIFSGAIASAQKIDAVKGKQYQLTKQHGPWMIMVASFHAPPEEYKTDGLSPEEAAGELVYELRKKGIPAYTFRQDDVKDQVMSFDRHGRERPMFYTAQQGSTCVLAGNYKDPDSDVPQKTLDYVKDYTPTVLSGIEKGGKFTQRLKNGGILRMTPGRPKPLSGAFLTINPLLSPDEVMSSKVDPLIVKINIGSEYSLLDNKGKYTVVVASFYGNSQTKIGGRGAAGSQRDLRDMKDTLDGAGQSAWELARALRQGYMVVGQGATPGKQQKFEAYVYHDRFRSIVTVGSFDRPDDPGIARTVETFRAKMRTSQSNLQEFLAAEMLTIPAFTTNGVPPERFWIFDPQPTVMKVPRAR